MTNGGLHSGVETFQDTIEKTFKITELKEKFDINVSPEELQEYKDALFSMKEIQKIKTGQASISELAKTYLDMLRNNMKGIDQVTNSISESVKLENLKNKEGMIDGLEASEIFDESLASLDVIKGKAGVEIKKGTKKAKEIVAKGADAIKGVGIMKWMENIASKGGLIGGFFSFILGILSAFGIGKKINDVKDMVKEKLTTEKIESTKNKVNEYITNNFGGSLSIESKNKLKKSLDELSNKQLIKLNEKLLSGKLTFSDITSVIPNIFESILKKEEIEKLKLNIKEKIIGSIKKEVAAKYNITIKGEKLHDLEQLVKNNTKISNETIGKFQDIQKDQQILLSDLLGPGFETIINGTSLFFGLLIKEIVPIGAFGLDFAEASTDILKLSVNSLGVTKSINIDTFNKSIENLTPSEKAILVGLLYRKGGLLLSLAGSIGESLSRVGIEFLTNTPVKTFDLMSASFTNNYPKQIKNLEKITTSLGVKDIDKIDSLLSKAVRNLNKVSENYKILHIISEADGSTEKALKLLKKYNIKIDELKHINNNFPFKKFISIAKDNLKIVTTEVLSGRSIASTLGFGANSDLFKLNQKLEHITTAQRAMYNSNFVTKGMLKIRELSNIGKLSRMGDRLVLHFESVNAAKKGISKWNILANKFPDLVKGTLDKLPIIAVAGIAANSDKPFFEEFSKEMKYLMPIVGPILLIADSGISWKNGKIESINAIEAGIGGALLTMDGLFLSKEFAKGGLRAGGSYMIKPIKDIYSMGKGTFEGAWSIGKAANNGKSFSKIITESVKKSKYIKKPKLKAIAIALGIIYLGAEIAFADNSMKEIFGKDGVMNKSKLKENISKLDNDDKILCLQYLITESYGEKTLNNVHLSISNSELKIESNNKDILGSWFIKPEMLDLVQINYKGNFKYNPTQKTA